MVHFKVDCKLLKKFIEIASMEGTVQFKSGKKVEKNLFNSFYLDVNPDGRLEVIAMDTIRKKTSIKAVLNGVEVLEDGIITITDKEVINKVLGGKGVSGTVNIYTRDNLLFIETDKDSYEISQKDNSDIKIMKKKDIIAKLEAWVKYHEFTEEGVLIFHHPTKGDYPYSMKINIDKKDILKVVGDSLDITKDPKTRIVFKNGMLEGYSGANNSQIRSKHIISFEDIGDELIEFDKDFYSIQTIIPNLFDHIEFNIRIVESSGMIVIYLRSIDEKTKIAIHMSLTSIINKTT